MEVDTPVHLVTSLSFGRRASAGKYLRPILVWWDVIYPRCPVRYKQL